MNIKIKKNKINWVCLGEKCKNNCCASFSERSDDFNKIFYSINRVDHKEILMTGENAKRIWDNRGGKYIRSARGCNYVRLKKDGSCPFLGNGRCSIYKDRPLLCRAYPFYIDASSGLVVDKLCSGIGQGWTDMRIVKEYIQSALKLYIEQIKIIKKQYRIKL